MSHKDSERFEDNTVFEGMVSLRAVIDGIKSGVSDRRINKVLFDRDRAKKKAKELAYIKRMGEVFGFSTELTDSKTIDEYALGTTHGGIIAFCSERSYKPLDTDCIKPGGFYVMIEGIEDPYNFGYAMRSLYAAGCDGIVLSKRNWLSAAGTVCRSSAGASELFDVMIDNNGNAAEMFKSAGYTVVCADIKNSKSVFDCELKFPLFLIVGGEKRGISSEILNKADLIVRLDYGRNFKNALSAASAASILAFEIFRQNKN